jgi:hypothetical protein
MKRLFAVMLAMTVVFTGCLTDSGDDGDDSNGTAQSASTYLPFKTGASWTFAETETDYEGETPQTTTDVSTEACTGQEVIGQKTYWVMTDDGSDPAYMRIDANGKDVYMYGYDFPDIEEWIPNKAALKTLLLESEPSEVLMFKFGASAGTTWTMYTDSYSGDGYSISMSVTGKYVGLKTVTTPMQQFSNCAQMDMTVTVNYTISYQGFSQTVTTKSINSMWFAPNVGPVKSYDTYSTNNVKMYEYTGLLTSYQIP